MNRALRQTVLVIGLALVFLVLPTLPGGPGFARVVLGAGQVSFDQATRDLASQDAGTRLRAAQLFKEAAYPESALPLAPLVNDPADDVQLEAIAAELNIFLVNRIVPRKRIGFVIEIRNQILAEPAFSAGPLAIGALPVPAAVLTALRDAARDDNPRVALEAVYAFGVLGTGPVGASRRELLHESGPHLAALLGVSDPALRFAAVRVIGRVFEKRLEDDAVEESVGDAVITALNDSDRAVKHAAMETLGLMRYTRAVQALTELFNFYRKGDQAAAALDAIARIANPASADLFVSQLESKNTVLRGIAIEGLSRLGDPARLPAIQTALASDRSDALGLTGAFAAAMLSNATLTPIVEALTRSRLRDQAWQYLVELAPGRATMFTQSLQDPDVQVRMAVVDALALGGDVAALPLVERTLTDRDPQVAKVAERAVARLRGSQVKPTS